MLYAVRDISSEHTEMLSSAQLSSSGMRRDHVDAG